MARNIRSIVKQLTLRQKAQLCSGLDMWRTYPIEDVVPSIMMTDGPHGLRKQAEGGDHLGIGASVPSTCFPSGAALASSWDRELLRQVAGAIGKEAQAEQVGIVLGPAFNIKRSPLCGRNFEYFSEDPYLSGELATAHINGMQSQGIGTSPKHFAANNQEYRRNSVNTIVDERTLREIYLTAFEMAVKNAQPWTVMCAYNRLNDVYCSENAYLLTDILKNQWGHEGFVMSDWGAVNVRDAALAAGLELEMPTSGERGPDRIVKAIEDGTLKAADLDRAVTRLLKVIFRVVDSQKAGASYDRAAHHALARSAASECMVLLKNNGSLPLRHTGRVAVIGAFAKTPRYQGGGSSHIEPTDMDSPLAEMQKLAPELAITYAPGYELDAPDGFLGMGSGVSKSETLDPELAREAVEAATNADVAVLFIGLPDLYETEGRDRTDMNLPAAHNALVEAVAKVQRNIVVVLLNGSPVEMPWLDRVGSVLEAYLGGQAAGGAIADLLLGFANPCGKLAETFPLQVSDNPSYLNFPGVQNRVEYNEGVFVGYRYYCKKKMKVRFPFGFGLSYTSFAYKHIALDKTEINDDETLTVTITLRNTGKLPGKEIVQLYVRDNHSHVLRPTHELKGFSKVLLQPGEEKKLTFKLDRRAFAYYEPKISDWMVESGKFEILVGSSCVDLPLRTQVSVHSNQRLPMRYDMQSVIADIMLHPRGSEMFENLVAPLKAMAGNNAESGMMAFLLEYPLRTLLNFTQGAISESAAQDMLDQLNEEA